MFILGSVHQTHRLEKKVTCKKWVDKGTLVTKLCHKQKTLGVVKQKWKRVGQACCLLLEFCSTEEEEEP